MTGARVTIVIPILNEGKVLPELLRRLRAVLGKVPGGPHEIVIVDDGSTDETPDILRRESQEDDRLVGVVLSRNFGHQAALSAGLAQASGDAIIAMDGDLQDPPESIPLFLEKYEQGYDVVYAHRVERKEVWWLRLCYYTFYRLITTLSGIRLPLDAGDFGLMSRRVVNQLREMPEYHRYLRLDRLSADRHPDRTCRETGRRTKIQHIQVAEARLGRNFFVFDRSAALCGNPGRHRHPPFRGIRGVCSLRQALPEPIAARVHCAHLCDYVPRGGPTLLYGSDRRICREAVRSKQGPAGLYRRRQILGDAQRLNKSRQVHHPAIGAAGERKTAITDVPRSFCGTSSQPDTHPSIRLMALFRESNPTATALLSP